MKVNGKDDIPYMMENNIHVWNHQPAIEIVDKNMDLPSYDMVIFQSIHGCLVSAKFLQFWSQCQTKGVRSQTCSCSTASCALATFHAESCTEVAKIYPKNGCGRSLEQRS